MRFSHRFIFAFPLVLLLAGNTWGENNPATCSVYPSLNMMGFFTPSMKTELKVTKEQDKELTATDADRQKLWHNYVQAKTKVRSAKLPKSEENAKIRALDMKLVDDLSASYGKTLKAEQVKRMKQIVLQVRGMRIFDYPEIQSRLKLSDKEVKELHSTYDKLAYEERTKIEDLLKAKQISREEAAQKAMSFTFSVPERIRESFSTEQKRILDDLLGAKYDYPSK